MSTVKFMHFRSFDKLQGPVVTPKGGATVAYIEGETGVSYGIALCHANDRYNRKKGRLIAEGRMRSERTGSVSHTPVEAFRKDMEIYMADYHLYRRS